LPRLARIAGFCSTTLPSAAAAHGMGSGFVLLLPAGLVTIGGALAVAASFLLVTVTPSGLFKRGLSSRVSLAKLPRLDPWPASLLSAAGLAWLVSVGRYGSPDPLANLLPLTVWTLWWIGFVALQFIFGDLWSCLNPWSGPYRLLDGLCAGRLAHSPPLAYPAWAGFWPAALIFFGFAWLELVDPAPADPRRLALIVAFYWAFAFTGMLLFGESAWRAQAEPFSIFFRLIAGLSPLVTTSARSEERGTLALATPGAALMTRAPLSFSGVCFVLLTLSSVTFDGLSRTFWWLARLGVNPLDFPGRSAIILQSTAGLVLSFAALIIAYRTAVRLGWILAGMTAPLRDALGVFVLSLIPISLAFHIAHYLTAFLVDGQFALVAASDPFARGQDLLGFAHREVTTSFLNTYAGVRTIWIAQTGVIAAGHVVAVLLAHALALKHFGGPAQHVAASQLPLAVLMVAYTALGLWLLSTLAAF
jgi:hypothetical protein